MFKFLISFIFVIYWPIGGFAANPFTSAACFKTVERAPFINLEVSNLPCQIESKDDLPQIVFFGETHSYSKNLPDIDNSTLETATEDLRISEFIGKLAAASQVFIANEGMSASFAGRPFEITDYSKYRSEGWVQFPIENEVSLALGQLVQFSTFDVLKVGAIYSDEEQFYLNDRIGSVIRQFWTNAYLQAAWKKVTRPLQDASSEVLGRQLDRLACDNNGIETIESWKKSWTLRETANLIEILREMFRQLVEIAVKIQYQGNLSIDINRLKTSLGDFSFPLSTGLEKQDQVTKLTSGLRETVMAADLGRLYCSVYREKRDIAVQVGSLHVPGMLKQLKQMFFKSGLNPALVKEADRQKIRDMMKSYRTK